MSTIQATPAQIRWFRLQRSGLIDPFATPAAAAQALFGVQAQILPAAGLALWNRTRSLNASQFDALLYGQRTLVKLWGQRHTLHLYASTDWPLLHGALALNRTWWERHLIDNEAGQHEALIEQVAALLRERPSMGRGDLRSSGLTISEELFSAWGGIFADVVRRGYACHAGRVGNEGQFAHREQWLPNLAWEPPDPDTANIEILRRFLAAYGPASAADFSYWRSISAVQTRRWFKTLADEVITVEAAGQPMLLLREDVDALLAPPPEPERWPVRLLYRFDPMLLAHKDKSWVVPSEQYTRVWRPAGHIEGIVLARGQAVATWRYDRKGSGLVITVAPFKPLPRYVSQAVAKGATQVAGFFGLPLAEIVISEQ